MGYTTVSAYAAFSTLPTTIICFVLRVNTLQNRCKTRHIVYLSYFRCKNPMRFFIILHEMPRYTKKLKISPTIPIWFFRRLKPKSQNFLSQANCKSSDGEHTLMSPKQKRIWFCRRSSSSARWRMSSSRRCWLSTATTSRGNTSFCAETQSTFGQSKDAYTAT